MGVKFGMEEGTFGPLLRAKLYPHRCNVSPLRGEKPQNRPLSKLNTGRFALRAMLPVTRGQKYDGLPITMGGDKERKTETGQKYNVQIYSVHICYVGRP